MKNTLYIFIISCFILACNSDDDTNTQTPEVGIEEPSHIGTWNWVSTSGGLGGGIHGTPSSTGKNIKLVLNQDLSYSVIENSIEIYSGTYQLELIDTIFSEDPMFSISYSNVIEPNNYLVLSPVIYLFSFSEMIISDNNYDGLSSIFEKM